MKSKGLHIHTDFKFISDTEIFFGRERFENYIVYVGKYNFENTHIGERRVRCYRSVWHFIISLYWLKMFDFVVFYSLNSTIVNVLKYLLPGNPKFVWRFFGMELYSKMSNYVFSSNSMLYLENDKKEFKLIREFVNRLNNFSSALEKIDIVLMLSVQEYKFLSSKFDLPYFIQLPHFNKTAFVLNNTKVLEKNKNGIIVGNNRGVYNNHLEILEFFSNDKLENITATLIFSYGSENHYTEAVRKAVKKLSNVNLLETFLDKREFEDFYSLKQALVINGYRQMAVWNILYAFRFGVKVYLSTKNSDFHWLKSEGFKLFTIEDFERDLITRNLELGIDDRLYNYNRLLEWSDEYSPEMFQDKLNKVLV